jgi:hypothetical protein
MPGLFGTFLYNSERERVLDAAERRTASVWPSLLRDETVTAGQDAPMSTYTNNAFEKADGPSSTSAAVGCAVDSASWRRLRPRTGPAHLVPWEGAFTRWLALRTPSPKLVNQANRV